MTATKTLVPYTNLTAQYREFQKDIQAALARVCERGDYILGEETRTLEKRLAEQCGVRHAIGVANGTDALILALKAMGIGPNDEVITAPNSFIASASAIALSGARPVFVDVREDLNIDPALLEKAITPRTRAILPVHLTGRCADMDPIIAIARKHKLAIIEDAAQSVGSRYQKRSSGSFGNVAAFSMHPLKNLNAMGDAGFLTTNDDALAEKLRLLRNHGLRNRDEVAFWGYNSRLDTLQAAILLLRLDALPKVIEKRRAIAEHYRRGLSKFVRCPMENSKEFHTYHLFVILAERRNALQQYLVEQGIETKIHYPIPIHLQPAAQNLGYTRGSLPVCERLAEQILSLPVHPYLSDQQIDAVCQAIGDFYRKS